MISAFSRREIGQPAFAPAAIAANFSGSMPCTFAVVSRWIFVTVQLVCGWFSTVTVAVVESVKTASDIYAPASGTVVAVNEALSGTPELVNSGADTDGWLFRLDVTEESGDLMDAEAYSAANN